MQPFVSVIIPCRNEEKFISKCLDSLLLQDYPKDKLEILVVDGASEDKTKEVVESYSEKHPFIKFLNNPNKFTPFAMNIGIRSSKGEVIAKADAHTEYPEDYISKCISYLFDEKYSPVNVGGMIRVPDIKHMEGKIARAIAICLTHPFGAAASFRVGEKEPKFVDTVFGGCYKKEILKKVFGENGPFFNEKLTRSQDIELNLRLRKAGEKILLLPDIFFNYYPKNNFKDFFWHNFEDGIWTTYPLKFRVFLKPRHYIPFLFVSTLILSLLISFFVRPFLFIFKVLFFLYLVLNIIFLLEIVNKEKDFNYLFLMPIAFFCRHFGYGLGSLYGLIKILKD